MLALSMRELRHVAVLGAHCDDIAIGAGGALLSACKAEPDLRVSALVLTGGDTDREPEERKALEAFCPGAELDIEVLDLPDGRVPAYWEAAKLAVQRFAQHCDPDLVLAPTRHDAHQDHRTLAELVPQAFRNQLILNYEIIKWESDLAQPSTFLPLDDTIARRKAELLLEHYPSQHGRDWYDAETFLGLARARGVQCRSRYAEGFFCDKWILGLEG